MHTFITTICIITNNKSDYSLNNSINFSKISEIASAPPSLSLVALPPRYWPLPIFGSKWRVLSEPFLAASEADLRALSNDDSLSNASTAGNNASN